MSERDPVELILPTPDDTAALAERLAPSLHAGDCLLLSGALGTGKTHFARALIGRRLAGAGLSEDIPSPTFTLVQTYDDGCCEIWHADLYRLGNSLEIIELGLDQAFSDSITLVEWPERLGDLAPAAAAWLSFSVAGDGRRLRVSWDDPRIAIFGSGA